MNIDHVRVSGVNYPVAREWPHDPGQPAVVCVRGLPPTVNEDTLESYLDGREIEAENIVLSKEEGTANIKLVNPRGENT